MSNIIEQAKRIKAIQDKRELNEEKIRKALEGLAQKPKLTDLLELLKMLRNLFESKN